LKKEPSKSRRKATIKKVVKKVVKKPVKKPVKKITKKAAPKTKKPTKKTTGPKYIQPKPAKTKDVPIPFPDSEKIPHFLLRNLVDIYYDFQGQRIQTQLRIGSSERNNVLSEEELSIYGITTIMENAKNFEKDIEKLIVNQLKNHALWTQYLSKIQGIGPLLAAGLIAYIDDIEKFDHVSSLWQYSGYGMNRYCDECKKPTSVDVKYDTGKVAKKLHPFETCPVCNGKTRSILQKRTSGYQSNWNDRLKVLGWKASSSFVKQSAAKSKYRKLYDKIKADEHRKNPTKKVVGGKTFFNDGHLHNRAMRKVSKIFFAHVWQTWRRQQGLEATEPYAKQLLGHSVVEAFTDK
jgi:hypothetical protein